MKEGKFKEYLKLIRIYLLCSASLPVIIGALSVKGNTLEISYFLILLLMGMLGAIDGYVLNDYMDSNIDKCSKDLIERPLVKGTITRRTALIIVMSSIAINFIILLIFFRDFLPIMIRIISVILTIFYNLLSKKFAGAALLLAGSAAFFCLFGAVAVSNNIKNLQELGSLPFVMAILFFIHVLFIIAIEVGLKDIIDDRKAGVKTLAVYIGVKASKKLYIPMSFKAIAMSLNIFTIILVFIPFIIFDLSLYFWQILFLSICIIGMLWSTIKMLNRDSFDRKKIRKYSMMKEIFSYTLFPLILMDLIGPIWAIFLILLPIVWYILFNFIIYHRIDPWNISTKDYI